MTTPHPLLPRELLFGNPDRAMARISPDGRWLSWLAPTDGVLNLWVAPVDDPAAAKPVTFDMGRGVRMYAWAHGEGRLLYVQDRDGDENWHVFRVDLVGGEVRDLTPIDGVAAQIVGVSHRHPDTVIVGLNDRNPQLHDLWAVDLRTGERTLVLENSGFAGFILDDDLNVRFGQAMRSDGGWTVLERVDDGWAPFMEIPQEDALTTQIIGFDAAGTTAFAVDSRGRDTAALVAIDVAERTIRKLAVDPRADINAVLQHPTERHIQAATSTYDRKRLHILDEGVRADLELLDALLDGDVDVVSRSLDDRVWVVAATRDDGPLEYHLYDRTTRDLTRLFSNRADLEGVPLAKMRPVTIEARDGLELVSYLTLPAWLERPEDVTEPLPMVLLVHGGPWARDSWGLDPTHQWLANRGYAVLAVNFRGSTGFGKAFVNAGDHEWAGKMHDDLIDAVEWAVKAGVADPDRVAIMGGSYGGYATLVGLTVTPERFACGVDIVGPSSLLTLIASIPPYWEPVRRQLTGRIGDPDTEEGRALLVERSPLTHCHRIVRPLLIAQGANDPRVKQAESDQIVAAMRERGIPVTYALFPDEGHGFARPANRLAFYAVAEGFLAEHLGGRDEGLGSDLDGSTMVLDP